MKMNKITALLVVTAMVFSSISFATETTPPTTPTTPPTTGTTTPTLTAEDETAIVKMANEITMIEAQIAGLKAKLAATTTSLTAEEKLALQNELKAAQTLLEEKYIAMTVLVKPTPEELAAMTAKAEALTTQIATLEKQIADGATTLTPEALAKLKADLTALTTELTNIQSALGTGTTAATSTIPENNPNKARFEQAKLLGITPGKMRLLEKLQAIMQTEIDLKVWAKKSVKQINTAVKAERTEVKSKSKDGTTVNPIKDKTKPVPKVNPVKEEKPVKEKTNEGKDKSGNSKGKK